MQKKPVDVDPVSVSKGEKGKPPKRSCVLFSLISLFSDSSELGQNPNESNNLDKWSYVSLPGNPDVPRRPIGVVLF